MEVVMASNVILVPVDFEEGSQRALELAKELGQKLGAEVALLHVYTLPVYTYPGLEPMAFPAVVAQVKDAAERSLAELARAAGVSRTILRGGETVSEILTVARELGASMIAMGTHGRRGLAHAVLGSIAERVVRRSPIPVLTVRAA
jgi:nucleotide-binding universal stress UspA family protein